MSETKAPGFSGGTVARLLAGQGALVGTVVGLTLVLAAVNAIEPLILKLVFDSLSGRDGGRALLRALLLFVALGVVRELLTAYSGWMTWRARLRVHHLLLEAVVERVHRLPLAFYRSEGVGALMTRLDRGIQGVMDASTQITFNVLPALVYLGVSVAVMFRLDRRLALLVLALVPLPPLIAAWAAPRQTARERGLLERWMRIYSRFNEVLSGIMTVKSFTREEAEKRQFIEGVAEANRLVLHGVGFDVRVQAGQNFAATLARAAALGLGGSLALKGEITVGTLIAFLGYVTGLFGPVQGLSGVYTIVRKARVSVEAISGILDVQDTLGDAPDAIELRDVRGDIAFERVRFRYAPDCPWIFDGFDLAVAAGETVALVGPSGGGKSTALSLLQRFYDPDAGRVMVDGLDIRKVTQESLRRNIGVVLQESLLFDDSVAMNIGFGRPEASFEEIVEAARSVGADGFIRALPDGYRTRAGERGERLSVGERQRVAIARALLKDPPILLFDEATSALDAESQRVVQEAMEKLMHRRTSIVVAHRLVTVVAADRVCLLVGGRVADCAPHAELVDRSELYATMVRQQVRGLLPRIGI